MRVTFLHALRRLVARPAFTLTAVATLALGAGATFAIFSVLYTVVLRPLPYRDASRLFAVFDTRKDPAGSPFSAIELQFWREQRELFSGVAGFRHSMTTASSGGDPEVLLNLQGTSELFDVLGVRPALGRTFGPQDERPGAERVAVISHRLWERRFARDASVVGRTVVLDGTRCSIIGVMPAGFGFPLNEELPGQQVEVWTPLQLTADEWQDSGDHSFDAVARLADEVGVSAAHQRSDALASRLDALDRGNQGAHRITLQPLHEQLVGQLRVRMAILFAAVWCVFLICCANVGNLTLVRAVSQQRQTAMKVALGAPRSRLVREWLTESLLVAIAGSAMGLLFAGWGLDLFRALNPVRMPRIDDIAIGLPVLLAAIPVTLAAGLVSALAAIYQTRGLDVAHLLKTSSRSAAGALGGHRRLTHGLLVFEIGASTTLAICGVLLIGSFLKLQAVDPGFDPHRVITAWTLLPDATYPEPQQRQQFFDRVLSRVRALPGVELAGGVSNLPITNSAWGSGLHPADDGLQIPADGFSSQFRVATSEYFRVMRIPLIRGRAFDTRDRLGGARVALVDEALARRLCNGCEIIGKRVMLDGAPGDPWRIVGVVRSTRQVSLDAPPQPTIYVPYQQVPLPFLVLTVRATSDPARLADSLKKTVASVDPMQALFNVETMDQILSSSLAEARVRSYLLGLLALVSLSLAVLGVYAAVSHLLAERTHELAVRLALGANPRHVRAMIIASGVRLTTIGVVLGIIGAVAAMPLVSSLLFGVSAGDPVVFAGVALALEFATLFACAMPAFRAGRIDVVRMLQSS